MLNKLVANYLLATLPTSQLVQYIIGIRISFKSKPIIIPICFHLTWQNALLLRRQSWQASELYTPSLLDTIWRDLWLKWCQQPFLGPLVADDECPCLAFWPSKHQLCRPVLRWSNCQPWLRSLLPWLFLTFECMVRTRDEDCVVLRLNITRRCRWFAMNQLITHCFAQQGNF